MNYNPFSQYSNNNKNNQYQNKYNQYQNNKNQRNYSNEYENTQKLISEIKISNKLCDKLTVEEVNLPEKSAYKVAEELKKTLKTTQLRKIFEQIKNCEKYLPDVTKTRNELYKVLPLIAYAVGREHCPKEFFELIKVCINEQKLKDVQDIKRLIEFLTTIVAYVKFLDK